jgi:hypothetical protein
MGNRDRAGVPIGIHASVKSPSIFSLLKATRMGFRFRGHSQNQNVFGPGGSGSLPL